MTFEAFEVERGQAVRGLEPELKVADLAFYALLRGPPEGLLRSPGGAAIAVGEGWPPARSAGRGGGADSGFFCSYPSPPDHSTPDPSSE